MKRILLLTGSLSLFIINTTIAQIFVDINASGANDGSSWTDAYIDLQDGLDAAMSAGVGTEVWVAKGIYLPTDTPDGIVSTGVTDRNNTFHCNIDRLCCMAN